MMRFVITATTLALFALPALAQTTTTPATPDTSAPATSAPATAAPAPASPAPAAPTTAKKKPVGHHLTLAQRFSAANATHDGHLTKDQATAAKWSYVAKHFAEMDSAGKGYVTMDDIHAYAHAQRALHHKTAKPAAPATAPAPATTAPAPAAGSNS